MAVMLAVVNQLLACKMQRLEIAAAWTASRGLRSIAAHLRGLQYAMRETGPRSGKGRAGVNRRQDVTAEQATRIEAEVTSRAPSP